MPHTPPKEIWGSNTTINGNVNHFNGNVNHSNIHCTTGDVNHTTNDNTSKSKASFPLGSACPINENNSAGNSHPVDTQRERTGEPDAQRERNVVYLGNNNLPTLPLNLLPMSKKDITIEYCQRPDVFRYFWVFDNDQRKKKECETKVISDSHSQALYMDRLVKLFEEITKECTCLTGKFWVKNFGQDGFRWGGMAPSSVEQINRIIKSKAMLDIFQKNLLYPFCATMKNVYRHSSEKETSKWLIPGLRRWANERQETSFDFDPQNNIVKIGHKGAQHLVASLHEAEEISFGMSLRVKALAQNAKKHSTYWQVNVDLTQSGVNDKGISTYLLVKKDRFPYFKKCPTMGDLLNFNRGGMYYYAHLLAHRAIATQVGLYDTIECLKDAYQDLKSGGILGPGKDSNDESVTLALPTVVWAPENGAGGDGKIAATAIVRPSVNGAGGNWDFANAHSQYPFDHGGCGFENDDITRGMTNPPQPHYEGLMQQQSAMSPLRLSEEDGGSMLFSNNSTGVSLLNALGDFDSNFAMSSPQPHHGGLSLLMTAMDSSNQLVSEKEVLPFDMNANFDPDLCFNSLENNHGGRSELTTATACRKSSRHPHHEQEEHSIVAEQVCKKSSVASYTC